MAFVQHTSVSLSRSASAFCRPATCSRTRVSPSTAAPRWSCVAPTPGGSTDMNDGAVNTSTEDVFAIDAGRDLFFAGLEAPDAIKILDAPLDKEYPTGIEDLFIAAERLKFFPSEEATAALIRYVRKFDLSKMDSYRLEMVVARRKAIESIGRHKGAFLKDDVKSLLMDCMLEEDGSIVEVCVWAVGEIGMADDDNVLARVTDVLQNEAVEKRVIIQTLLRAKYSQALEQIRPFVDSPLPAVASAASAAVATFDNNPAAMSTVVDFLKSGDLNDRRSAIADITLTQYVPALEGVAVCPNSLVLRSRTTRVLLDVRKQSEPQLADALDDDTAKVVDRLIWDHPMDLDLLGMKKETRKSRDVTRNIRQLYKNDALFAYLACRTLGEDHRENEDQTAHAAVLQSYHDLPYFDYFGAYHAYKTLGWLKYQEAYELLLENAEELPPRFFNHKAGAITALAELNNPAALPSLRKIAKDTDIWEVKYACLISAERLGDNEVRELYKDDTDWLVRARCRNPLGFDHLRTSFTE